MDKVAVIVVTYRSESWIRQCLDSVFEQEHVGSVYVVDNASDDQTIHIVQSEYPQVHVISNVDNVGFAAANNQALKLIAEDYALLLNPDAFLEQESLTSLLATFDEGVGMVGPRIIRDKQIEASICEPPSAWASWLFLLSGMRNFETGGFSGKPVPGYPWNEGAQGAHIRGSCMMVSKAAIADVGLLDERFFLYFEETEWCLRLFQKGWKIKIQPKAIAHHIGRASMKTASSLPSLEFMRGAILFWSTQYNGLTVFILRMTLFFMAAVKRFLLFALMRDADKRAWLGDVMKLAMNPYTLPIIYPKAKRPSYWDK